MLRSSTASTDEAKQDNAAYPSDTNQEKSADEYGHGGTRYRYRPKSHSITVFSRQLTIGPAPLLTVECRG